MAPEIFLRKNVGASASLDIWSLGCILYALVLGVLPFEGPKTAEIKANITTKPLSFPKDPPLTEELRYLLCGMLNKEPEERIRMQEIVDHPWIRQRKFTAEEREDCRRAAEDKPSKGECFDTPLARPGKGSAGSSPTRVSPKKIAVAGLKRSGDLEAEGGKKVGKGKKN